MQKVDKDGKALGPIERVPRNKWAQYRQNGYEFREEAAFNEQQAKAAEKAADAAAKAKASDKKK